MTTASWPKAAWSGDGEADVADGRLLNALRRAYRGSGFDQANGGGEVPGQLVLLRNIEPVSKDRSPVR